MSSSYIETTEALEDFCKKIENSPFITIDTEFLRERTYYAKLALIQIANSEVCVCIDPLSGISLDALKPVFQNSQITKVMHACSQDLEILFQLFGELPQPIFDTQIASAILGYGAQISYAQLVDTVLDLKIDKTQTRTDWTKRPLSNKQIEYAENDVKYLAQIYPIMLDTLEKSGKSDWLMDDFLSLADPEKYIVKTEDSWRRVKGNNKLNKNRLIFLMMLASWREKAAMKEDKPRKHILQDDALITIARIKPDKIDKLYGFRELNESKIRRYESEIMSCITVASKVPESEWPSLPRPVLQDSNQEALTDAIMAIVKLCAHRHNLSPTILANRKDIEKLVSGNMDIPVMKGWRKRHVGDVLSDFLAGKECLHVQEGKLMTLPDKPL